MATTYKVLGQSVSVANTAVHGYTVPTGGNAVCVAVDIGLLASDVLSTFARPTIDLSIPLTVPVNVGLFIGALAAKSETKLLIFDCSIAADAEIFELVIV